VRVTALAYAFGIRRSILQWRERLRAEGRRHALSGVVQNRVTVETRNPFVGAALSIFGVTRNQHFLNHAQMFRMTCCNCPVTPDTRAESNFREPTARSS